MALGTDGGEGTAEIGEHLARLGRWATGADQVALSFLGFLADEHHRGSVRDDNMSVGKRGSGDTVSLCPGR